MRAVRIQVLTFRVSEDPEKRRKQFRSLQRIEFVWIHPDEVASMQCVPLDEHLDPDRNGSGYCWQRGEFLGFDAATMITLRNGARHMAWGSPIDVQQYFDEPNPAQLELNACLAVRSDYVWGLIPPNDEGGWDY